MPTPPLVPPPVDEVPPAPPAKPSVEVPPAPTAWFGPPTPPLPPFAIAKNDPFFESELALPAVDAVPPQTPAEPPVPTPAWIASPGVTGYPATG